MELGTWKCPLMLMKSGKIEATEATELQNQKSIRTRWEEKLQGLINNKIRYKKRVPQIDKTEINTWVAARYSGSYLKWIREDLWQINKRKTTLVTIY